MFFPMEKNFYFVFQRKNLSEHGTEIFDFWCVFCISAVYFTPNSPKTCAVCKFMICVPLTFSRRVGELVWFSPFFQKLLFFFWFRLLCVHAVFCGVVECCRSTFSWRTSVRRSGFKSEIINDRGIYVRKGNDSESMSRLRWGFDLVREWFPWLQNLHVVLGWLWCDGGGTREWSSCNARSQRL